MRKQNVKDLPIALNVCEQVLREVEKQSGWSMAHVIMNPLAKSLLHKHQGMKEIYVITKGYGELWLKRHEVGHYYQAAAGRVFEIWPEVQHLLQNNSGGQLEHLVLALPPFDSADVQIIDEKNLLGERHTLYLPKVQDCFDGARILSYPFPQDNLSIAFGWVINDPQRRKKPHYHKKITERVFVVEGKGFIEINQVRHPIQSGDWICINPGTEHGFVNESPEDLVVVCICSPAFEMDDVYYGL